MNAWVNNREAGDLRHYRAHYDVIVMWSYPEVWFIDNNKTKPSGIKLTNSLVTQYGDRDLVQHGLW